jgi:PTH1 family peptidyl-tRNA hydrolase
VRAILGIGNPGPAYSGTRHNCGFLVVDELARRAGGLDWSDRFHALAATWRRPAGNVLLLKPQTFVNESGVCALAVLAFHKLAPADLLVVTDDLHLPLGQLRLRGDGGAGGHNGLKDLIARIGPAFPRLRLGIGKPVGEGPAQVDHVLGRFSDTETPIAQAMIVRAADAVAAWLDDGLAAMNRVNAPAATGPAQG